MMDIRQAMVEEKRAEMKRAEEELAKLGTILEFLEKAQAAVVDLPSK